MTDTYSELATISKKREFVAQNLKCINCKDVYLTYSDAYRALRQREKVRRDKKAIYRCEICGKYHLHSKDGESYRHIKYNRYLDRKLNGDKINMYRQTSLYIHGSESKKIKSIYSKFYIILSYGIS